MHARIRMNSNFMYELNISLRFFLFIFIGDHCHLHTEKQTRRCINYYKTFTCKCIIKQRIKCSYLMTKLITKKLFVEKSYNKLVFHFSCKFVSDSRDMEFCWLRHRWQQIIRNHTIFLCRWWPINIFLEAVEVNGTWLNENHIPYERFIQRIIIINNIDSAFLSTNTIELIDISFPMNHGGACLCVKMSRPLQNWQALNTTLKRRTSSSHETLLKTN